MAHDVKIVSARADKTKADLVAKRLRALKFRVRYDAKREHTTPTKRDLTETERAGTVLVLWSKAACDPDNPDHEWVRALAGHARTQPRTLYQASLDATVPPAPFNEDTPYKLTGMGPKRIPKGFHALADALGDTKGRAGLSAWLKIPPGDTAAKEAWKEAHPDDPITLADRKKAPAGKAASDKAPSEAAADPADAAPGQSASERDTMPDRLKPKLTLKPPVPPSASSSSSSSSMPYRRPHRATLYDPDEKLETGWMLLGPVMGAIALMLLAAWFVRSEQVSQPGMPAVSNAVLPAEAQICPPGQVPRYLIEIQPLRTGPIIDDTEEAGTGEEPAGDD